MGTEGGKEEAPTIGDGSSSWRGFSSVCSRLDERDRTMKR